MNVKSSIVLLSVIALVLSYSNGSARSLTLVNSCKYPVAININSNNQPVRTVTIPSGTSVPFDLNTQLAQNGSNAFHAVMAPPKGSGICSSTNCNTWSKTLQKNPAKGYGSNWLGKSEKYAKVCQATMAAAVQCPSKGGQSSCCGTNINQDGSFGSLFEITPNGYGSNDYIDISTNYSSASGPSPFAPVFFSIPFMVSFSGSACISNNISIPTSSPLVCLHADCDDAYQYAIDPKQLACPNSDTYTVTYCPQVVPLLK